MDRVCGAVFRYKLKEAHENLPNYVPVKVLNPDIQREVRPYKTKILSRELNIHGELDHPNVVKCYGYCTVMGSLSLVMKYCKMDLKSFVQYESCVQYEGSERRLTVGQLLKDWIISGNKEITGSSTGTSSQEIFL